MKYQIITRKSSREGLECWIGAIVDLETRLTVFSSVALSDAGLKQILINRLRSFELDDRIKEYENSDEYKTMKGKKRGKNAKSNLSNRWK